MKKSNCRNSVWKVYGFSKFANSTDPQIVTLTLTYEKLTYDTIQEIKDNMIPFKIEYSEGVFGSNVYFNSSWRDFITAYRETLPISDQSKI